MQQYYLMAETAMTLKYWNNGSRLEKIITSHGFFTIQFDHDLCILIIPCVVPCRVIVIGKLFDMAAQMRYYDIKSGLVPKLQGRDGKDDKMSFCACFIWKRCGPRSSSSFIELSMAIYNK